MYFHHFEKKIIVFPFRKYQAMKMIWKQVLKIKWVFKISILTKIPQLNWVIGLYKIISFGSSYKRNLYIYFISNGMFLIQVYQVKKHGEEERKSTTMLIAKKKTILVSILAYKNIYKQKNINIFLIFYFFRYKLNFSKVWLNLCH